MSATSCGMSAISEPIHGNYWAEGPSPLFVNDTLYVYYDCYMNHRYGAARSTDNGFSWEVVDSLVAFPRGMRHGTAFSVTKDFLQQLLAQVEENERLQSENSLMLPKARIYDQVMQTPEESWLSTTSAVANEIGMSAQKLNRMLCACGIIYKTPSGEFLFCSEYLNWNLGKTVSCVINEEKGRIKTYLKWNTRGRAYIHALNDTNWDKRRAWHLLKEGKEVVAL